MPNQQTQQVSEYNSSLSFQLDFDEAFADPNVAVLFKNDKWPMAMLKVNVYTTKQY